MGATSEVDEILKGYLVSIHAPVMGATGRPFIVSLDDVEFQFTRP